ncbi:MAG: thioredoxin family protein [Bacteroidaceae bacterium]|nr:thioredoxin family protein [Bacteroidaceae bacterium]
MNMKKRAIITILLALVALAGQAKVYKTIKAPKAMASNIYRGELKAREVILADTASTIHFTMEYPQGQNFRFVNTCYLMDEDGARYPLHAVEGIKLDSWVSVPESGSVDFTMHFAPMPKRTKVFDFIEGDVNGAFVLLGIHDSKKTPIRPSRKEKDPSKSPLKGETFSLPLREGWGGSASWFQTDTITIKGRIEGYDAERFGFTSMECYYRDLFEKDGTTLVLDIAPDGTFQKKFLASYPVKEAFITDNSKVGFDEMPFFARPGETIDITVRETDDGRWDCQYNNGSSKEVERLLKSKLLIRAILYPLNSFKGTFAEANQKADEVWQNLMYRLQVVSRRDHFTPLEMQLAMASAETYFAEAYMSYALNREGDVMKQELRDGVYYEEILDSTEWKTLFDMRNYDRLSRIDFDNPLLLSEDITYFTINRIQFAKPVRERMYKEAQGDDKKRTTIQLAALRDLLRCDHNNLLAQLCIYKEMLSNFKYLRLRGDSDSGALDDIMQHYFSAFTHPYVRQKAEAFYARKMAEKDLSTPLPANNPMADFIRSLSEKYPGRFLLIDFWGMGCGPCRGAIQQSKQQRAEIAKRDDVKLIFIADESTPGGSEAYRNYVKEWLADEDAICVSNEDFRRFEELFRFTGIPHYETITPDCRRVRDDLQIDGYYNFDGGMQLLKAKFK